MTGTWRFLHACIHTLAAASAGQDSRTNRQTDRQTDRQAGRQAGGRAHTCVVSGRVVELKGMTAALLLAMSVTDEEQNM